jgi:shikimate kinase
MEGGPVDEEYRVNWNARCGKSTVGVVLAKVMGYRFIDADLLIQERENRLLSEIIEEKGPEGFNQIENEVNAASWPTDRYCDGGSVVYGKEAMAHLAEIGVIVYIRLPLGELETRLEVSQNVGFPCGKDRL